jgi:hypothetical protein
VKSLSDIIGNFETFSIEETQFKNLTISGGEMQVVKSRSFKNDDPQRWNKKNVQTLSSDRSSTAIMGAAYCFGFQTF